MRLIVWIFLLVVSATYTSVLRGEIVIDGRLSESEWQNSNIILGFLTLSPLSLERPKYETKAKVFSTEKGIYFGFVNYQPSTVKRERTSLTRDSELQTDRNTVIIDFNGNHNEAYEFSVSLSNSVRDGIVTNEKDFGYDWDGIWHHRTHEEGDYWYSEIMIPWSSVVMSDSEGNRTINIYLAREVSHQQLRFAYPNATTGRATFISDLSPIKINSYAVQALEFFPYISVLNDQVMDETKLNAGAELFWKPSSNKQFSLTLNPDFGQVESDNLVVNFSSLETFFSEKRPFFTEDQSLFLKGYSNGDHLVHTRRIGSAPDHANDPAGISDIDFALKYSLFDDQANLGAFMAIEDDTSLSRGRRYVVTRLERTWNDDLSLGYFLTYADRPTLDRTALAQVIDLDYDILSQTRMTLSLTSNDIEDANSGNNQDYIVDMTWDTVIDDIWSHNIYAMHIGDEVDLNDLGYMSRNDLNKLGGQHQYIDRLHRDQSAIRESSYTMAWDYQSNTENDRLESILMFINNINFRNTSRLYYEIKRTFGWQDDRTMQNGEDFKRKQRWGSYWLYDGKQTGSIKHRFKAWLFQQDFDGVWSKLYYQPTWNITDQLSFTGNVAYGKNSEWLIWRNYDMSNSLNSELVSFDQKQASSSLGVNWYINESQELRLKFEWIAIKARANSGYEPGANGYLQKTAQQHTDFELSNTALQVRYRYELDKLSNLYVVWSRGANFYEDNYSTSFDSLLSQGWSDKTVDQFLVKVRYRF